MTFLKKDESELLEKEKMYIYILELLSEGFLIPDIAKIQDTSTKSINRHIAFMKKELNCKTIAQLVYTAAKRKIIK